MNRRTRDLVNGAIAGAIGSGLMTVARMMARRAGIIDAMVPEAVERWATEKAGVEPPGGAVGHRALDQILHHGYGAAVGGLYGLTTRRRERPSVLVATGFGLGVWAFGSMVLFPALGITRPAWDARPRELAMNVAAHLLFGGVTAYLTDELAREPNRPDASSSGPAVG